MCTTESAVSGDAGVGVFLKFSREGLNESGFRSGNANLKLRGVPWSIETDQGVVTPNGPVRAVKPIGNGVAYTGSSDLFDWRLDYTLSGTGRITKTLSLTAKKDFLIKRVTMWNVRANDVPIIAKTNLQDIAAFYRHSNHGLFVSLDFPYSRITTADGVTTVDYPPYDQVRTGETYTCRSLTFGGTKLTGAMRYGFDEGEEEATDSYVQQCFTPRFNRPMFVSCSIVNRYCQPRANVIWYTMKDHPSLSFNPDILKRDLTLMPKLGMEYYQVFTGPFDSVPTDPDPKYVKEISAFARKNGVRIGDYSGGSAIFCPHYNEYEKSLNSYPEWGLKPADVCFGNPKFVDFYISQVVPYDKKYNFELHCLDFLSIQPCNNPQHGHPVGADSIYSQVVGITRVLEALNSVSPEMMTWSNSGNWSEFLPKIAWTNPNLYLTDPYIASPWQGLNMTRLLDDARREQMVSLHWSRFIPYRNLTNCQYFFSQNSIVPDIRNYKYGALSTIAVTPNLCLAEIRPWLDRLPETDKREVLAFYKRWTTFLKKNYSLWTKTYQAGVNPGTGSVEIYSHASGSRGFIFIVNPNYWSRTVEIPLGPKLGFKASGKCEIVELHPNERLRLTAQGPFADFGTVLPITIPAQQVVVLEVRPAPAKIDKPRMYGLPGSIEASDGGCVIRTTGAQGTTERFAVLMPPGHSPITSMDVNPDIPKQPKRLWSSTPVKILGSEGSGTLMEVTFRKELAPTELGNWHARPGSLEDGESGKWQNGFEGDSLEFPLFANADGVVPPVWRGEFDKCGLGPLSGFCGAYIDNAFGEQQETVITLKSGGKSAAPIVALSSGEIAPKTQALPKLAKDGNKKWWLSTAFDLPFMYTIGAEPSFDEHTFLVLPFVNQSKVRSISAWVNGSPLEVRAYRYPRNRGLACYFADLVGTAAVGGNNKLVVHFETE